MTRQAVLQSATYTLNHRPTSVRSARACTRRTLAAWALLDIADDVTLLVSELVTNAIVHTADAVRCQIELALNLSGRTLRADITDHGHSWPGPMEPPRAVPDDESGRGLTVVNSLADKWGVELLPDGKTVWFLITVRRAVPCLRPSRTPSPRWPGIAPADHG
ncbi:ATP-binding protein [Spongiactinospora sp. TRM90649]|uniref:ATP-binding protein n=1 Tax=Spongiactinospora sp. TRM90649 TaxID=3031114 RepID=UPI0023F65608|nr:ATP-binding protein [Spongiactinospora sp. TRM90649]MDF5758779.1 ATP-binding protein [Spongiactinospora sp. TRM90649]